MAYRNAVLDDANLQDALKNISPAFGDFCTRVAGEAWGLPLIDQKTKAVITIAVDQYSGQFLNKDTIAIKYRSEKSECNLNRK